MLSIGKSFYKNEIVYAWKFYVLGCYGNKYGKAVFGSSFILNKQTFSYTYPI